MFLGWVSDSHCGGWEGQWRDVLTKLQELKTKTSWWALGGRLIFWDFGLWPFDNESTNQCRALEKAFPNLLNSLIRKKCSSYCEPLKIRHLRDSFSGHSSHATAFQSFPFVANGFLLFFLSYSSERIPLIWRQNQKSLVPPRTSKIFKGCFCNINNSSPSLIPIFWAQPSLDTFRIHTCDAGGQGSICSPKSPSSQETVKKPSSTCPSFLIFKSSTSDTTFVPSTSLLFFWDLYRSCAFFFLQFAWSFVEETASVSAFKAGRKIKWSGRGSKAWWNRIQLAWIDKQI